MKSRVKRSCLIAVNSIYIFTLKILELPRSCSLKFCFVPETKRKSVKPFLKVWDFYNLLWISNFSFSFALNTLFCDETTFQRCSCSLDSGESRPVKSSKVSGHRNYDHDNIVNGQWWSELWSWSWLMGIMMIFGHIPKSTIFFSWPYWDIKISKWTHKTFPKIIWLCHFFVIFRFVRNIFLMTVAFDPL